jgi:hypothetical protein
VCSLQQLLERDPFARAPRVGARAMSSSAAAVSKPDPAALKVEAENMAAGAGKADKADKKPARVMVPNPEEAAHCCSRNVCEWLTTIMTLGVKRSSQKDSLHLEDLGPAAAEDEAQKQADRFHVSSRRRRWGVVWKQRRRAVVACVSARRSLPSLPFRRSPPFLLWPSTLLRIVVIVLLRPKPLV